MKQVTVSNINQADVYLQVIRSVMRYANVCSLTVRSMRSLSEKGTAFLKEASRDLNESVEADQWPGTKLFAGKAIICRYNVSPHFKSLFSSCGDSLNSWMHPHLPEDPAFYRPDGSLIFGSVSHEADAFLELLDEEISAFDEVIGR